MVLIGTFMGIQPRRKIENGGIHPDKTGQEISRMYNFTIIVLGAADESASQDISSNLLLLVETYLRYETILQNAIYI